MSTLQQGVKLSELQEIEDIPDDAYLYVVTGTQLTGYKIKKKNLIKSIYDAILAIENGLEAVEGSTWISRISGIKYTKINDQWIEI